LRRDKNDSAQRSLRWLKLNNWRLSICLGAGGSLSILLAAGAIAMATPGTPHQMSGPLHPPNLFCTAAPHFHEQLVHTNADAASVQSPSPSPQCSS